jgi:hypothetical protein
MASYKRNGFKWSVNELLRLQREFELLQLSIDEIAYRHQRSPDAIMYKLDNEGFADYNVLYSNYYELNDVIEAKNYDSDSEEYFEDNNSITQLTEKVWSLETNVNEIKILVKELFNTFSNNNSVTKCETL